ncbi:MAG: hypothetical protein U0984_14310, partial [Prosthecobacter sp.]|nr:hypothetical protein [Prosthecobacter sp.]
INAPFRNVVAYPFQGEGDYRIVAFQGSTEIGISSGVNTFTVGHAWNLPDTFTKLDYGLYWFKDVKNGMRGRGSLQHDEYFDPSKPTVIYVHGWQQDEVGRRRRESWLRQDPLNDAITHDMCKIWKRQGYNVGMFNWNQFADGELLTSQANIYYIATESGLPAGHSMIYARLDSNGKSGRHIFATGTGGAIEGKTVCDLFAAELSRCMQGYVPGPNKEFRMIGHSLGTQVVGRTCDAIRNNPGWGIPLPTRISLLEIAQINGLDPTGLNIPELQRGYISGLAGAQVAIDCYQSTDLQSLLGVNLAWVGPIHDMSAYCRWRPDYIKPLSVGLHVFAKSHNEMVRWYMQSFDYYESQFKAFTYLPLSPIPYESVGYSLSATTTNTRGRTLMSGNYWYEQTVGKDTSTMLDDVFERKN